MLIATVLLSCWHVALADEPIKSNSKKWEYKIWLQPDDWAAISSQVKIEKKLNELGAEGWELVNVMWKKNHDHTSPTGRAVFYFKRVIQPRNEAEQGAATE